MTRWLAVRFVVLALMFAIGGSSAAAAGQTQTSPTATPAQPASGSRTAAQPASSAPADPSQAGEAPAISDAALARIRKAVASEARLKLDDRQFRYYVQILAKQQAFSQFTKGYNWKDGATRGGNPMTHQEFVNMVTPREMYSSAGITPTDLLQFSITNWLGQALIKKALNDISNARTERELQQIRDRIDRELAMLKGGGS
jgi:hypothetical protein